MPKILLIDDDAQLGPPLAEYFSRFELELELAGRPSEGLAKLRGGNFDAAVLDVHLHGLTVYEVAEVLQDRGVPFIFTTGFDKTSMPTRFDAIPVVQKPTGSTAIAQELSKLLSKPQAARSLQRLPVPPLSHEPPVAHFACALARQIVA